MVANRKKKEGCYLTLVVEFTGTKNDCKQEWKCGKKSQHLQQARSPCERSCSERSCTGVTGIRKVVTLNKIRRGGWTDLKLELANFRSDFSWFVE